MRELLLKDETLSTADIAHAKREGQDIPVGAAAFNPALQDTGSVARPPVATANPTGTSAVDVHPNDAQPEFAPVASHAAEPHLSGQAGAELREPRFTEQPAVVSAQPSTESGLLPGPLFPDAELEGFRSRWNRVQTSFVDEPREAVQQADFLVANVVRRIAEQFSAERQTLERQWEKGQEVSTEDLRQALKRYRSFFERLLSV